METNGLLLRLINTAKFQYIEENCMAAARKGEIFRFHSYKDGAWCIIPDMELQAFINIIDDRAAETNSESEEQVLPKQLKKLTKLQ